MSERDTGVVDLVTPDGSVTRVGRISQARHAGTSEGGLLGIAYRDGQLYACYTTADDNRIVRMPYADGQLRTGQQQVLVSGIPRGAYHDGGRIAFGPDGMLYAGTGDGTVRSRAQDRSSLGGKILRMRPDGSAPSDNPFAGSLVYSLGHRNVQGLAWDASGQLWADEFGQDRWDELNVVHAGDDDGWPEVEGPGTGGGRFVAPVEVWIPDQASPSGIAITQGAVWMAALGGERLWEVPIGDQHPTGDPTASHQGRYGRLRTAVVAPDGSLWLSTSNTDGRGDPRRGDDRILRITF